MRFFALVPGLMMCVACSGEGASVGSDDVIAGEPSDGPALLQIEMQPATMPSHAKADRCQRIRVVQRTGWAREPVDVFGTGDAIELNGSASVAFNENRSASDPLPLLPAGLYTKLGAQAGANTNGVVPGTFGIRVPSAAFMVAYSGPSSWAKEISLEAGKTTNFKLYRLEVKTPTAEEAGGLLDPEYVSFPHPLQYFSVTNLDQNIRLSCDGEDLFDYDSGFDVVAGRYQITKHVTLRDGATKDLVSTVKFGE